MAQHYPIKSENLKASLQPIAYIVRSLIKADKLNVWEKVLIRKHEVIRLDKDFYQKGYAFSIKYDISGLPKWKDEPLSKEAWLEIHINKRGNIVAVYFPL